MNLNDDREALSSSADALDFLRRVIHENGGTISALARRCGFRSRAHLTELLSGKRRLTAESMTRLIRGLALEPTWRRFFLLLVARDYPQLAEERLPKPALKRQILALQRRIQQRPLSSADVDVLTPHDAGRLVAALSTPEVGTSFASLVSKSGLTRKRCREVLDELVTGGFVRHDEPTGLFFPVAEHLVLRDHGVNPKFAASMAAAVDRAAKAVEDDLASPEHLFLNSVFCLPKTALPRLKTELRELLVTFIDRWSAQEGDSCVELTLVSGPQTLAVRPLDR